MKTTFLSIVAIAMISIASISCASHTTYRTVSENPAFEEHGKWKRCNECDGKGPCTACRGTGRISGDACRNCKGTGKCPSCKGNGGYYVYD